MSVGVWCVCVYVCVVSLWRRRVESPRHVTWWRQRRDVAGSGSLVAAIFTVVSRGELYFSLFFLGYSFLRDRVSGCVGACGCGHASGLGRRQLWVLKTVTIGPKVYGVFSKVQGQDVCVMLSSLFTGSLLAPPTLTLFTVAHPNLTVALSPPLS